MSTCFVSYSYITLLPDGPCLDLSMTLSIHSSRDADPKIEYSLSFNVSFGPPSKINCSYIYENNNQFFGAEEIQLSYKVIRSQYVNSSLPDMTQVTVRLPPQPRDRRTYNCTVAVEGLVNISSGNYMPVTKGTGSSSVKLTGEGVSHVYYMSYSSYL